MLYDDGGDRTQVVTAPKWSPHLKATRSTPLCSLSKGTRMRILLVAGAALAALLVAAPAHAESAQPVNPDGYADVVQFGAHEDHDLYPGPGNVIGDVRSAEASTGEGTGLSTFVMTVKEWMGSTPNPPGLG